MDTSTLIIGGGRDRFYGSALFRETAEGLPNGHLMLHPRKTHMGAMTSPVALEEALRFLDER